MADVFVSYKRQDEAAVGRLVKALRAEGLRVWWDRDIPTGAPWEDTIEREHEQARSLVVCWSKASVASENVKAEARRARATNRLVQTFIETCDPPMFFGERQGVDLSAWSGRRDDARFRAVLEAVRAVLDGREVATGVGVATSGGVLRKRLALAAAAGAVLLAAGVAAALYLGRDATPRAPARAPAESEADRALAAINGGWGVRNRCDTVYRYAAMRDPASGETHIVTEAEGFRSEGRVVSVTNGVILSEALTPASDRGNLVEIRPEPTQLVLQDRRTDTRQVLIRCR